MHVDHEVQKQHNTLSTFQRIYICKYSIQPTRTGFLLSEGKSLPILLLKLFELLVYGSLLGRVECSPLRFDVGEWDRAGSGDRCCSCCCGCCGCVRRVRGDGCEAATHGTECSVGVH